MKSRPTVLASIVLSLALLGDSLLYALLPLHASTFGVSLAFVGVLLSANRIVRLFVYPILPRLAARGLRRFTITAAGIGALSTLVFALGRGPAVLLASRLAWGIVFGALSLSVLAYATERSGAAGRRVGLSLSLRELGPLAALTLGTASAATIGVRVTLCVLAAFSVAGVFVAWRLPELETATPQVASTASRAPRTMERLSFVAGFVMDGMFPATIGLVLARATEIAAATAGTGLLLAFRRLCIVLLAPPAGHAADRFGARIVTTTGLMAGAAGAISIGFDQVIAGALLLACGAALTTATIPAAVAQERRGERVAAFASVAMTRDAGAALGTLIALASFNVAGAAVTYWIGGALLGVCGVGAMLRRPIADGPRLNTSTLSSRA